MYNVADVYDNVKKFNFTDTFSEYSRVEIDVSDEKYVASGNKTGRTLRAQSPWATKKVAENVLAQVKGFEYQPYTAGSISLDPAVELGDGVFVKQVYSGVYTMETTFGKTYLADISAPSEEETDHEYPYKERSQRQITRRVRNTESRLNIQADQISAKVSKTGGNEDSSFEWVLSDDSWVLKSNGSKILKVDKDGLWVSGNGRFTGEVYAKNIKSGDVNGYDAGHLSRSVLSDGVRNSLKKADESREIFEGTRSATMLRCESMIFDGWIVGRQQVTIGGQTIRYLGWVQEVNW